MEPITRKLKINIPPEKAFQNFVRELNEWWPKEYTWSQDKLKEIKIDAKKNGLCTEIGPNGFRCDWGTVTEVTGNERISLKWQIGPNRDPIPDPDKASDLLIEFLQEESATVIIFEHSNFEKHGKGFEDYRRMMDSAQGWDYILNRYKNYCRQD